MYKRKYNEDFEENVDNRASKLSKQDYFGKDGYPFRVITSSPNIGNNINFYSKFIDLNKNEYFFNFIYNYEENIYKTKNNISLENLKEEDIKKIYLNIAFKFDTIHDFTDSRSLNRKDNDDVDDVDDDENDEKKSTRILEIDEIYRYVGWDKNNLRITDENENIYTKITASSGFENEFFYWILKKSNLQSNNLYTSSCIENFTDIIANQKKDKDKQLKIVVDASEKRINNFKNLLLFQKFISNNKNKDERNVYCSVQKEKNKQKKEKEYKNDEYDEQVIINSIKSTENNLKPVIIFPQLFDANATSGKSIKWRGTNISTMLEDNNIDKLEFYIIDDKCNILYNKNENKSVLFQIENNSYPLNIIKIIQQNETGYNTGEITYTNETFICYNRGPGVKELINFYRQYLEKINILYVIINEIHSNKEKELNDKKISNISKLIDILNKINISEFNVEIIEILNKIKLNEIIEVNEINDIDKIIDIIKNSKNLKNESKNIKKIIKKIINNLDSKKNIVKTYTDVNELIKEIKNINRTEYINEIKNKYNDYKEKNVNLSIPFKFLKDNEINFVIDNFINSSYINTRGYKDDDKIKEIFIETYKKLIANNIFIIKRAGDYSQIKYCNDIDKSYIFSSNDRMSASFCLIEKVNFIGPFVDSGIFLKFNNEIEIKDTEYKISECKVTDKNCYVYNSITVSPDIRKYIKYILLNEVTPQILNSYDYLFDIEYNSEKNILKCYKNLAFKLDTIHDFKGSRSYKIDELYSILWNTNNETKIKNIKDIVQNIDSNLEKNFLFWILQRQRNNIKYKIYSLDNEPLITFSTSIENFSSCISGKENKIYFNIDASDERINNFKNIMISNSVLSNNINEIVENFKKKYEDDEKKIIEYFNIYQKYFNKDFLNKLIDVSSDIINYFYQYGNNINIDFLYEKDITKNSYRINRIKNIFKNIELLCNYIPIEKAFFIYGMINRINFLILRESINIEELNKINNDLISKDENFIKKVKKVKKGKEDVILKLIKEYVSDIFNKIKNELYNNFFKYSIEDIKQEEINNYVTDLLNESNSNIKFKITPPQLIDSNATTGVSVSIKSIDVSETIDDEGEYCKIEDIFSENIDKNMFENNINKIIKELYDINTQITEIKLNDPDYYESKLKRYVMSEDKLQKIYNSNSLKNLDNELSNFINIFNNISSKILDKNKLQIYNFINMVKDNINIYLTDHEQLSTVLNNLYTFKNNFLKIYNKNKKCEIDILNDKLSIYFYNLSNSYTKINGELLFLHFNIVDMNINNDKLSELYPIQKIKVVTLKNKNEYKSDIDNFDTILLKQLAKIIASDIYDNNLQETLNKIDIDKSKNNDGYLLDLKDNNNNNLIKLCDKKFYYCFENKTLYSLENGGPGVKDLLKIYKFFYKNEEDKIIKKYIEDKIYTEEEEEKIKELLTSQFKKKKYTEEDKINTIIENMNNDEKKEILDNYTKILGEKKKGIYSNIFAIKRSGDYLQIYYCKINNYIFVSTDQMSASFCFLENCEFIGPFGDSGIFIKKKSNENLYCNDNIVNDYTTGEICKF